MNIRYNNETPEDYDAWLATIPVVTHSTITRTRTTIPNRDGELLGSDDARGNAFVNFTIHMRDDNYATKMRSVRRWLSGTGVLVVSDEADAYYEVLEVTYPSDYKKTVDYGRLEVRMEVYPYEFLVSGNTAITSFPITNAGDTAKPLITITGNGSGTLTINRKTMNFTVNGTLIIDTRKFIAYNENNVNCNANIDGYYEDMWLKHGSNSVSITSGFSCSIKPRWGYVI